MHKKIKIALLILIISQFAVNGQMKKPYEWKDYEKVLGLKEGLRHYDFDVIPTFSSAPANVFWEGDPVRLEFQIKNNTESAIEADAKIQIIQYGTTGIQNNIWLPQMVKLGYEKTITKKVSIPVNGFADVGIEINDIKQFSGYAVVIDLGKYGRRLGTSFAYGIKPNSPKMQYPKQSLDNLGVDFLSRVGVKAIRMGAPYIELKNPDFKRKMDEFDAEMKRYHSKNITVLAMFEEGGAEMPLGQPRPHLDKDGVFLRTKQDYVWHPKLDNEFKDYVKNLCIKYGWPNGPITAVSLWNEPWEGISISGWQSDMIRYREIYQKMAEGVLEARKQGADVLIGGGDSNSNALDKFFADGTTDIFPTFDFLSIHYQGMESPVLYPEWNKRKDNKGRVLIWDTESWVGNTDDRIGMVVAANRSAGYDRSMGIYGGYMYSGERAAPLTTVQTQTGTKQVPTVNSSWSAAAAMCAVQTMIGEREFNSLLFQNGLPWVMVFDGYSGNKDDGTVVIAGDLGESFGRENILFRQIKLSPDAKITLKADKSFRLYDFYGNTIAPKDNKYIVPLTYRGYYLRTNGEKGSFDKLVNAVRTGKIDGYSPVEIIAKDFTSRIAAKPEMELVLTNILNREVNGKLTVSIDNLQVDFPKNIKIKPNETKTVKVKVISGNESIDNNYALNAHFDAGKDGISEHQEIMHVNVISKRTITVDGNLDDWKNAIPQVVKGSSEASISLTEAAWYPFQKFDENAEGFAQGYLAYDNDYFYFAAKVADKTPNKGSFRFETRDDDQFFYPEKSYKQTIYAMQSNLVKTAPNPDDKTALQHPTGNGRILNYIENTQTTQSIGLDIDLPTDKLTQTTFYLPNIAQHGVEITVTDRDSGKELLSNRTDRLWNGAYLVLNLSGKVRIRFSAYGWWYTAKLSAVFFDSTDIRVPNKASAILVNEDFDTLGNWKNQYGKLGNYIVGLNPNLPANISVSVVSKDDLQEMKWDDDIRRFTYRKRPTLPDGTNGEFFDNILIAFNVIPIGEDGMEAAAKGTMPKYIGYKCSDYEYALNPVAPEYGGGFEIWRMLVPGMPRKHFYPRQPKSSYDGAVKNGKLITVRDGNTLYTECAIPWSEIPDVKACLDSGKNIKFSYRVNDDGAGSACLELARGRSVSKKNSRAFHPDWKEHWANEVEFGFEK